MPEEEQQGQQAPVVNTGFQFEGDYVSDLEGKLPAMTVEMPEAYGRGTILRLNVEVRVKSVRLEENRKGDLVRQHVFALESINLAAAYQPQQARDTVGGSASATPRQTSEEAADLGLTIGRSSDAWDGQHVQVREGEVDPTTGEIVKPLPSELPIDDWEYDGPEGKPAPESVDSAAGF